MTLDPHSPYLEQLAGAGDWAGLVRYWMVHELHAPALDRAIDLVRNHASAGGALWPALTEFLEDVHQEPVSFERPSPQLPFDELDDEEQATLVLLLLFPRILLCASNTQIASESQFDVFQTGIETVDLASEIARNLGDSPVMAFLNEFKARALYKSKDLESAQTSYLEALKNYRALALQRREVYLPKVVTTLNALGKVQYDLNDLKSALETYQEALKSYRTLASQQPEVYLEGIAVTLNALGNVQSDLKEVESALESYQEALKSYRTLASQQPEVYLPNVAITLYNLGNLHNDQNDLKSARKSFREALKSCRALTSQQLEVYLPEIAIILYNLGNVQYELNDLQSARKSYQEALEIRRALASQQPENYLPYVAMTLFDLGCVQNELNDLEPAQKSFQEALEIRRAQALQRPEAYLPIVAAILNNLGAVQRALSDLESALESYQKALKSYRTLASQQPEVYLPYIAMTLNNLGNNLGDLKELKSARRIFEKALRSYRELASQQPEIYLHNVAITLNNLGNIHYELNDMGPAQKSFRKALRSYRELASQHPKDYLPYVAITLHNLGNLQRSLNDLESARKKYQKALKIRRALALKRREVYLPQVAATLSALGNVQSDLNDLESARKSYQEAADLYELAAQRQPTSGLVDRQATWANLGQLVSRDRPDLDWPDWPTARKAFGKAVACAEAFRELFRDETQRHRVHSENLNVYERLIEVCVDLWEIHRDPTALAEAVETAEKSRARRLMELLARESLRPANTPSDLVAEFQATREQLQRAISRWEHGGQKSRVGQAPPSSDGNRDGRGENPRRIKRVPSLASLRSEVNRSEASYLEMLRRIHVCDSEFNPDRPVSPIDVEAVRRLIPRDIPTAVVQYTLTERRSLALVITDGNIEHVPLTDLDNTQALEIAITWYRGYHAICRIDGNLSGPAWSAYMEPILADLGRRAIQPVVERLKGIQRLILVPHRVMRIFPLHVCYLTNNLYLCSEFEVSYAPSLSVLNRCVERQRTWPERLLSVENPTGDLGFTESESAAIRGHFSPDDTIRKQGSEARRGWLLENSNRFQSWHYAGHSKFDSKDPLASGLVLEGINQPDRWLSLRDIFTQLKLPDATLVVLSGCESGSIQPDWADECVGLPSGFLFAGATCVIASLWIVPDLATSLLMGRFYANWRQKNMQIGASLSEAQRWLRDDIKTGRQLVDHFATEEFLGHITNSDRREFCRKHRDLLADKYKDSRPFAGLADWAAFMAIGLAFPQQR